MKDHPRKRLRRPRFGWLLEILVVLGLLAPSLVMAPAASADPGLSTQDLSGALTADDLAAALVGTGVTVSNVAFTGAAVAAGKFSGGGTGPGAIIGFDQGVILSSGAVGNVVGPNEEDGITTVNDQPGDADLDGLLPEGQSTQDAAALTFDFVPDASSISFRYVFSSDEYNEFVGSGFDDVFGFFVNGTNCATVGGDRVSVDSINGGNPFGTGGSHPELYRNNDPNDPGPPTIDTEMDGLTVVLTCTASVIAGESNSMKLAIADVGDSSLDSNVFIEAGSLTTEPPGEGVPGAPTNVTVEPGNGGGVVGWTPPADPGGSPIDSNLVTCTNTLNGDDVATATVDGSSTLAEVSGLTNGETYTCVVQAHNASGSGPVSEPSDPFTPSDSQAAAVIDTSVGGTIKLFPDESFEGTSGRLVIPPQTGSPEQVVVFASLFGHPGEIDPTCGGNQCIGQGIEWGVSDPGAVTKMKVIFIEAPSLVGGVSPSLAKVYKDGVLLPDCPPPPVHPSVTGPCVRRRGSTEAGGWRIKILATGEEPKGRI